MYDSSRAARELLRAALDLLDDQQSLIAAAMVEGALSVLQRDAVPAPVAGAAGAEGPRAGGYWRAEFARHRSCA